MISPILPRELRERLQQGGTVLSLARDQALHQAETDERSAALAAQGAFRAVSAVEEFELPNGIGSPVRLTSLLARGPVLLAFYRGRWSEFDRERLRALEAILPALEARGGGVAAISPQVPDEVLETAMELGLSFECLSDTGNVIARRFGLVPRTASSVGWALRRLKISLRDRNGMRASGLPLPADVIVGQGSVLATARCLAIERLDLERVFAAMLSSR